MILGEFSPSLFFKLGSILTAVSILIMYAISQHYHHDPPFPKCWISDIAAHYPEYILFRIATISGSVLLILGYLTNNFYLRTIAKENNWRLTPFLPTLAMILGIMGGLALMGSTANSDTGQRNPHWHQRCAMTFFLASILATWLNNIMGWIVYLNIKTLNKKLLIVKTVNSLLIYLQAVISALYATKVENLNKFLEWTLTYSLLFGFYLISLDVTEFNFVHIKTKADQ